jgi:hypothetical protein
VFRRVFEFPEDPSVFTPSYMFSIPPIVSGAETLITVGSTFGVIKSVTGTTEVDVSAPGISGVGANNEAVTHTFLGNVAYLNRVTSAPLAKRAGDATFVTLPNWDASDRTRTIRAFKDFVLALNVIKGGVEYPSMVKWSDVTGYGSVPASWDPTITTNSAGENVLSDMQGPILDGHALRDSFFIYGRNEVWAMSYIGGSFIFDFRKRFDDVGVINPNCIEEIDGLHYVFDQNDIYKHDGSTKVSIIHGKNKDFVFQSLVHAKSSLCFTHHDPKLNEIHFCYASSDRLTGFPNAVSGCNRSAVYNYRRETWTFYDLPNAAAATTGAVTVGQTYNSIGTTAYDNMGGTYIGDDDAGEKHSLFCSRLDTTQGLTKNRILGIDLITGGRLARPLEDEALRPAFIERIGIDLDEKASPLRAFKSFLGFYPQVSTRGALVSAVKFQFGAAAYTGIEPIWDDPRPFNPATNHKIDVRVAGRYLAYRLYHTGITDFDFSGFDMRMTQRGQR